MKRVYLNFIITMEVRFDSLRDIVFCEENVGKELGSGGFAKVKLVQHRDFPGRFYALKIVRKGSEDENKYTRREAELHSSLNHPNIIKFHRSFESDSHFYFLLEYAPNGDLFDFMYVQKPNKKTLLRIMYEVCLGVQHLHQNGIMH